MAILDWTTDNSLFCIDISENSGTPTQAASTVSEDFSVDVTFGAGAVDTVTADWGDGTATEALVAGVGDAYDAAAGHIYASAGKYDIRVTVVLDTNETAYEKFTITVT